MPNPSHVLQPKHTVLKSEEAEKLLEKYNISLIQLPKIKITDPALPNNTNAGDIVKIERHDEETGKPTVYFRAVIA